MVAIKSSGQIAPLAVSIIFIVIIALSITLRIYSRRLKKLSLGIDDYLIFAATVCTTLLARKSDLHQAAFHVWVDYV
jgi:hypothetical protein